MTDNIKTYFSHRSRKVLVGNLIIGDNEPIPVQSMTNTNTLDTTSTVNQVEQLAKKGCDIVRITAPAIKDAENLYEIKNELLRKNIDIPIVADIHFNPNAADVAAKYVEKIRINPGNYIDRNRGKAEWSENEINDARKRIEERLIPLLGICKENNTAIRIGTNHGSLSERILSMYGNTARGMVESAMEFVRICVDHDFHNLVLSMKASNVRDMTAANILLVEQMIKEGHYYPVHLGVTEAGNGREARIKSAAGIGSLLARGIGDTIRVSLAEDPIEEVPVGKRLIEFYGRNTKAVQDILSSTNVTMLETEKSFKDISGRNYPVVTKKETKGADLIFQDNHFHSPTSANKISQKFKYRELPIDKSLSNVKSRLIFRRTYNGVGLDELLIRSSVDYALLLSQKKSAGLFIENNNRTSDEEVVSLCLDVLQGLGLRYSKAEFVACPSCGRTKFNLFESFDKVKAKTSHLKELQIAVMGCIVNGPGEMGDADYGYVGAGPGKVTLYKSGEPVIKNVEEDIAVDSLINLIKKGGDWVEVGQ